MLNTSELEKEFKNNEPFLRKINNIKKTFPNYRKVRRDGSCFYRSYLFGIFERITLLQDANLLKKILEVVKQSKNDLIDIGY